MLLVYVTDQCREDAKKHSWGRILEATVEKVEKDQTTVIFDDFPHPWLVKKQFGARQGRLIAARKAVPYKGEEILVIVFLAVLIRGDRGDYDGPHGFGHAPEEYGRIHFEPRLTKLDPELSTWVDKRLRTEPPPEKPILTEAEQTYLYTQLNVGRPQDDILICESRSWVDSVIQLKEDRENVLLARILEQLPWLCDNRPSEPISKELVHQIPEHHTWTIVYRWEKGGEVLHLCDLCNESVSTHKNETNGPIYRSYPAYLLADEGMREDIETHRFGNYALSEEEEEILWPPDGSQVDFPLFINGRAGSGKSTILQYLYAEYFARYAAVSGKKTEEHVFKNPPAYFACSSELLSIAEKSVGDLLRYNPAYSGNQAVQTMAGEAAFQQSFRTIHGFLLSRLNRDVRTTIFRDDRFINFNKFRRLYAQKCGWNHRDERGADAAWHVIRTFIKGFSTDDMLSPNDYAQIGVKEKTVTQEDFTDIYERVWKGWYKDWTDITRDVEDDEGGWDDQDLVRYVLEHNLLDSPEAQFPGIFCDEAQDFTHIEIYLFLKMCVFLERKIDSYALRRLPVVFAGDEFQTLNPTGFSWDSAKAAFHRKFIQGLCPQADESSNSLVCKDLHRNYRSTGEIVRFTNSIQMFRAVLFDNQQIEPQQEWHKSRGGQIFFFNREDPVFRDWLKRQDAVRIIVPCLPGEELEFIQNDPCLSQCVRIDKEQRITTPSVDSAITAKGREFSRVVVYGFGESLKNSIDKLPKDLLLEYFINRLYVAASRPRDQLFLADSRAGVERLWHYFESAAELENIRRQVKQGERWAASTASWILGTESALEQQREVDYSELAEQEKRSAEAREDSAGMYKAAQFYRHAGRDKDARVCTARALSFKGEWQMAAKEYERIKEYRNAGDCYWRMPSPGGDARWKEMARLASLDPNLKTVLHYQIAEVLATTTTNPASLLSLFENQATNPESILFSPAGREAVDQVLQRLVGRRDLTDGQFGSILVLCNNRFVKSAQAQVFAKSAYSSGNYPRAKAFFEQSGKTDTLEYFEAAAACAEYPQKLDFWKRAGNEGQHDGDILELWSKHQAVPLATLEQKTCVAAALVRTSKWRKELRFLRSIADKEAYASLVSLARTSQEKTFFSRITKVIGASASDGKSIGSLMDEIQCLFIPTSSAEDKFFATAILARIPERDFEHKKPHEALSQVCSQWQDDPHAKDILPAEELAAVMITYGRSKDAQTFVDSLTNGKNVSAEIRRLRLVALDARIRFLESEKKNKDTEKIVFEGLRREYLKHGGKPEDIKAGVRPYSWESLLDRLFKLEDAKKNAVSMREGHSGANLVSPQEKPNYNKNPPPTLQKTTQIPSEDLMVTSIPSASPMQSHQSALRLPTTVKSQLAEWSGEILPGWRVEWFPGRKSVTLSCRIPTSELNGTDWKLKATGIRWEDAEDNEHILEAGKQVSLPGTPFEAQVDSSGIRIHLIASGNDFVFPIASP